ncbi:MAG: TIGR00159 family protein [Flavobacteriales bacterium]|nr:MAG: TIGR00159 family protein [Flavobacteriales bacterium]
MHLLLFINIRWLDILDILLVAFLIYQLYNIVKGTAAIRIFIGILAIYIFWKIVEALKMDLLTEILGQFIGVGVIALIIVFQQELRRFLLLIGTTGFRDIPVAKRLFNWKSVDKQPFDIQTIVNACSNMSNSKTGALMVLQKESNLSFHITSGDEMDAQLSQRLIESIFFKNNPLHDGAIIIVDNRIKSVRCVLPVSDNQDFPAHLGMRHRAGVGITESSDAVSVIVSEETGDLAFGKEGQIKNALSLEELKKLLQKEFS